MVQVHSSKHMATKFVKYGLALSFVAIALSAGLAACGKKSGDNANTLTVGSLSSDGYAVTSNTSIGGYPVSLVVQNIQPTNGGTNGLINGQQQCGINSSGYYVCNQQNINNTGCYYNQYNQYTCANGINGGTPYSSLIFTVSINGQQQQLSTSLQFGNSFSQRQQAQVNGMPVYYEAGCYDQSCTSILLTLVIGGTSDFRQIAIRKDMRQNKIVKLGEWQVTYNNQRSLQQIMTEL